MKLLDRIRSIFATPADKRPPGERRTVGVSLGEPPSLAGSLTVPRLLSILRNAEAGDTSDLFALYREMILGHAHFQTVFNQRKLAPLTKALTIRPVDDESPADIAASEACKWLTKSTGWLTTAMSHLVTGHLYPVAVLECVYGLAPAASGLRLTPKEWAPVPYHLLDYTTGKLMIWDADPVHGHRLGTKSEPTGPQYIVHRGHLLSSIPDNWGGPMRAALFWFLFSVMDRDWWVRFLDRFGAPFIVGKYEDGRDADRRVLTSAFQAATRLFGLVVNRETDIQVHSVATSSHGEAFEKMQAFANGELSKLILGQTMTTSAQAGGLGGSQAQVQENVRGDIEAWDITALAETVKTQIIAPFLRFNGIVGDAELAIATATGAEMETQSRFLTAASQAGLEPTDEGIATLSKSSGIPLQRQTSPATPPISLSALSASTTAARLHKLGQPTDAELDRIATAAAPKLAAAFRGRYEPIRHLIATAPDAMTLQRGLAAFTATLDSGSAARLTEEALIAYAATAAATTPR